nr:hypothetical protein [Schwartzia sp. (in: firmicutes)]
KDGLAPSFLLGVVDFIFYYSIIKTGNRVMRIAMAFPALWGLRSRSKIYKGVALAGGLETGRYSTMGGWQQPLIVF